MATTTSRFGLIKHTDADPFVTEEIADNWQAIDSKVEGWLPPDTLANRPSPSEELAGFMFWAYDEGRVFICVYVGEIQGSASYGWRNTGVTNHSTLADNDPDPHPQYLPSSDHDAALHDALGIDAATLEGEDLAGIAGRYVYTEAKTSNSWVNLDQNAYFEALSLTLNAPFGNGVDRYKVAAFGAVWMNGGDSASEGKARFTVEGDIGTATTVPIGMGEKSVPAADEFEDLFSIEVNVVLEAKDPAGASLVESSSLFVMAIRTP